MESTHWLWEPISQSEKNSDQIHAFSCMISPQWHSFSEQQIRVSWESTKRHKYTKAPNSLTLWLYIAWTGQLIHQNAFCEWLVVSKTLLFGGDSLFKFFHSFHEEFLKEPKGKRLTEVRDSWKVLLHFLYCWLHALGGQHDHWDLDRLRNQIGLWDLLPKKPHQKSPSNPLIQQVLRVSWGGQRDQPLGTGLHPQQELRMVPVI